MVSIFSGWANGTLAKLGPKVLEPLYSGNLAINIATKNESSLIRGKLAAKLVAEARDSPHPFLLKREENTTPPSAVGIAWLSFDNECHLHYDVSLSGMGTNDRAYEIHLELLPMIAPNAPVIVKVLEEFQGNNLEGSPTEPLGPEEMTKLDSGVAFLKIKDRKTKVTLLAANLQNVSMILLLIILLSFLKPNSRF